MKRAVNTKDGVARRMPVLVVVGFVLFGTALRARAETPIVGKQSLLYMVTNKDADHAEKLAKCDRLTIEEYKKRGVRVIERTGDDLAKWVDGDGKGFAKATPGFQQLGFARAVGADAVGGLGVWVFAVEEASQMPGGPKPGVYFHGWGMTLGGVYRNNNFDLTNGDKVQAIPLRLSPASDDPWAIARTVAPEPCSAGDAMYMAPGGSPFLGVSLDGIRVTDVTNHSPASKGGMQAEDELASIDGRPIDDIAALVAVLGDKKVGDAIDLTYRRGGKKSTTRITLEDRAAVMALNSPVGKPLPDLVGKDIHGKEVRLRDLRGKVVLLDFWATWCSPCVEGAPTLQLLSEHAKGKDFVWVGVSVDDDEKAWKNFVKHNQLGGIQVLSSEWAESMGVYGYPTLLLVDRNGMVQCELHDAQIAPATMAMLNRK